MIVFIFPRRERRLAGLGGWRSVFEQERKLDLDIWR